MFRCFRQITGKTSWNRISESFDTTTRPDGLQDPSSGCWPMSVEKNQSWRSERLVRAIFWHGPLLVRACLIRLRQRRNSAKPRSHVLGTIRSYVAHRHRHPSTLLWWVLVTLGSAQCDCPPRTLPKIAIGGQSEPRLDWCSLCAQSVRWERHWGNYSKG